MNRTGVLILGLLMIAGFGLLAQTTQQQQRDLLETLIFDGTNGECWVRNDAVSGGGEWGTCGSGGADAGVTGTGTDTHVAYWTGASTLSGEAAFTYDDSTNSLAVDTTTLAVDGTNNRVGIGTASPSYDLHIYGTGGVFGLAESTGTTSKVGFSAGNISGGGARYIGFQAVGGTGSGTFLGASDANVALIYAAGANTSAWKMGTDLSIPLVFGNACTGCGETSGTEKVKLGDDGVFVVNEQGFSYVDARFESDNQASCLLVDASADVVSAACDVQFPTGSIETGEIEDGTIREADLMVVDTPSDEECLTYETSTGDFEWQTCGTGGSGDSITVNSSAATDPDFLNGDIDWTLTGGNSITATVGCSQCVSYSEIQDVSTTNRLLGRDTAGAGVIEEIGISAALDMLSASAGVIPYRDASSWNTGAVLIDTSTFALYPALDNARDLGRTDVRWDALYVTHLDNNGGSITVDGNWMPSVDNAYFLGDTGSRWGAAHIDYAAIGEIDNVGSGVVGVDADLTPTSSGLYDLGSTSLLYSIIAGITVYGRQFDAPGDEDMDYGSADVDDHTFTTDGTGDSEIVLPADSIGDAELNDNTACKFWPVDSIFISMSSTNPGTSLGCGTWSAFGAGRVLVSLDSGDTSWDTAGETGGSKTHNHTYTQVPNHTHDIAAGQGSHQHGMAEGQTDGAGTLMDRSNAASATTAVTDLATLPAMVTNNPTGGVATGTTNSDNGIAMPYIAVYMWRRTA